jgi:hypothetical protein
VSGATLVLVVAYLRGGRATARRDSIEATDDAGELALGPITARRAP